jgi:hypothetical protein
MITVITIFLCISLLAVAHEDLRYRAVSWPWFIVLACASLLFGQYAFAIKGNYVHWGINFLFILLQASVLLLYLSLKYRKLVNPFKEHIGLGDFLFVLAIIPAFAPFNYILFIILSMSAALVFHQVIGAVFHTYDKGKVPLAGLMGINMLVLLVISKWLSISWLDDSYILTVIMK